MPDFHVFYCRHRTGDMIESHAPEPMKGDRIAALACNVLEDTGDFFGLVDDDDSVLQLMVLARGDDDDRRIRMEIPDMSRHGCHIKYIARRDLPDLLKNLPERLSAQTVSGLKFRSCK